MEAQSPLFEQIKVIKKVNVMNAMWKLELKLFITFQILYHYNLLKVESA